MRQSAAFRYLAMLCIGLAIPTGARGDEEAKPLTIVAFGDSTTAFRGELVVYSMILERELTAEGRQVTVINSGKGGDNTAGAAGRFETDVLAHDPDLVIIQFGINDSAVDVWKGATEPRVPIEDYERNLEGFVTALTERGCAVIIMTSNPLRWTDKLRETYGKPPYDPDDPEGFNLLLPGYVERARQVAARHELPLVDSFRAFTEYGQAEGQSTDDLLLDGMHPSARGHEIEAEMLLQQIRAMMDAQEPQEGG